MLDQIPKHYTGKKLDYSRTVSFETAKEALRFFREASGNLKDINHWHLLTNRPSAEFQIMNGSNEPQNRSIKISDYIRIDIPGPGLPSAKGYDWVQVEKIAEEKLEETRKLTITLRPSDDPTNSIEDTAHFFNNIATSSLSIELKETDVTLIYAGRNELINTENNSSFDNIRNFIIGLVAKMGASYPQWKALIDGLADINEKYKN